MRSRRSAEIPQSRKVLERVVTPFNTGVVVARGRARHLEVEGATYASYHPVKRFFGYAWDALSAAVLQHRAADDGGTQLHVLLIGMGGGTVLHALRMLVPHARVSAVEIDEALVGVTRRHFDLDGTQTRVHVGDGYQHVDAHVGVYDVILDDAFVARGDAARFHDVTVQFVQRMKVGLRPGGLLACNVFTDTVNTVARLKARQVFGHCFPHSFELEPPKGANAIMCGTVSPRAAVDVARQVARLPNAARNAMRRVKGPGLRGARVE